MVRAGSAGGAAAGQALVEFLTEVPEWFAKALEKAKASKTLPADIKAKMKAELGFADEHIAATEALLQDEQQFKSFLDGVAKQGGGVASNSGRWIGSKVGAEATEAAFQQMLARMKGLKAGAYSAVDDVRAFGSRSGSTYRGRGPLDSSDLDIAIKDFSGLKGSRHYDSVKAKLKSIADDFYNETGIRVELHLKSAYNPLDWVEKIGF